MAGGIEVIDLITHIYANPFFGIIGLTHDRTIENNTIENPKKFRELELDAIFSFSGMSYLSYVIKSQFLGYLVGYLTNCTGRRPDLSNYFFHESTWNKENVKSDS